MVFGLVIGSFLNVCIRRIPQGLSIVLPASRCPRCQTPIKPYDNIPVLSWVLLGGRCRACRAPISAVYPAVELLTGLLFAGCVARFGLTLVAVKWAVFSALLMVLIFTDIFERILPDKVNFLGFLAGLAFSLVVPVGDGTALWLTRLTQTQLSARALSLADALLGAVLVSLPLWLFAEVFSRLIGRAAMGFGDVKMMVMVGSFLGFQQTFLTLLLGAISGTVIGGAGVVLLFAAGWKRPVAVRAARRKLGSESALRWALARRYELPLGTFLGAAAVGVVFFGPGMIAWYASLFR
jgi:leader peptidase (prepilin peptidase)/N-methyltransferase